MRPSRTKPLSSPIKASMHWLPFLACNHQVRCGMVPAAHALALSSMATSRYVKCTMQHEVIVEANQADHMFTRLTAQWRRLQPATASNGLACMHPQPSRVTCCYQLLPVTHQSGCGECLAMHVVFCAACSKGVRHLPPQRMWHNRIFRGTCKPNMGDCGAVPLATCINCHNACSQRSVSA